LNRTDTLENELIRNIAQACGQCKFGQGKGVGLVCPKTRGQCPNKKVKKWLKELEELKNKGGTK
jgi:hypothetical protein